MQIWWQYVLKGNYNQRAFKEVDKKRAAAVSDQLKKLGVTNSISVDFKGIKEESDSASGDEEEKEIDWAKNRRVQFIIKQI